MTTLKSYVAGAWHTADTGFVPLFLAAALVVYGFYRSLAGQALFREALQEEEAPAR